MPGDAAAVRRLRRLHLGGMLCNAILLFAIRRQHSLCQRDGDLIRLAIGDKANIAVARFVPFVTQADVGNDGVPASSNLDEDPSFHDL